MSKTNSLSILSAIALASAAYASKEPIAPGSNSCAFCDYWKTVPVLYKSDTGFLRQFKLNGMMQYQYAWVDANEGTFSDGEFRRFQLGATATFAHDVKFVADWYIEGLDGLENGPNHGKTVSYAETMAFFIPLDNNYTLGVGKHKPLVLSEARTSSSQIKTIERSILTNQLRPGFTYGISLDPSKTNKQAWQYGAGLWTAATQGEYAEWCDIAGDSTFLTLTASRDASSLLLDKGRVTLDYIYQTNSNSPDINRAHSGIDKTAAGAKHVISLYYEGHQDKLGLTLEATGGLSDDRGNDLFGIIVMPTYNFTDKLEGIFRYSYVAGSEDAVRLTSRYERSAGGSAFADSAHSFYTGVNYYICENNLKLMLGIEYTTAESDLRDGFDGWTLATAVRAKF